MKGSAADGADDAKTSEVPDTSVSKSESAPKPAAALLNTEDLTMDQVRSTLQLVNKMLRKEAKPQELAALLKIKEVREILELHKVNPKESSERITKYQKDLAARLRAHDRGKRTIDESSISEPLGDGISSPSAAKKAKNVESTPAAPVAPPKQSRREMAKAQLTGILAQSELALPPSGSPPNSFSVEWIQYFFQSMCSKIPFFPERKLLVPGPSRTYVEESDDQRIYIDGLSSNEIILLLNFIFDLESHLLDNTRKGDNSTLIVPNKFVFIPVMGDPLESGLLDKWYFTHLSQCATCALRFANRKLLTIHHDYHYHKCTAYQRRRRGLENNFRGWMEPPGDWLTGNGSSASSAIQYSSSLYSKMDEKIVSGLSNLGLTKIAPWSVSATTPSLTETVTSPPPVSSITAHHSARTQTEMKSIISDILPESVPVDEIKCKCLECGDLFEKVWIGEPVDLAVYRGVVAVPIGSTNPLQFRWPVTSDVPENVESGDEEDDDDNGRHSKEAGKIDAINALSEHRFINSLFIHKHCFTYNPRLRTKEYQLSLLENEVAPSIAKLLTRLCPPGDTIVTDESVRAPDMVQLVQEEDEDEEGSSSMIIA